MIPDQDRERIEIEKKNMEQIRSNTRTKKFVQPWFSSSSVRVRSRRGRTVKERRKPGKCLGKPQPSGRSDGMTNRPPI